MALSSRITPFILVVSCALLWAACDSLSASGPVTYNGTVLDDASGSPIQGATISVEGLAAIATTDQEGTFSLVVDADSTGQPITLNVTASDYEPVNLFLEARVDEVITLEVIRLEPVSGPGTGSGASREAESITLAARSSDVIGVREAGADETATLEFIVLDPSGRPITSDNSVELTFSIGNGPGGGETLEPATASTGSDGKADVTLTSGTRSGTVQVVATTTVGDRTLRSQPVTVTITGGLPDADHFSVGPEQFNVAGYNILGIQTGVTAYVGDKYGNPVQPSTAVYFTTDGGIIEGSGVTNGLGAAGVTLVSAAPRASNAFNCGSTPTDPRGYTLITASTSDENNETVLASTTVLYTSSPTIAITSPAGLPFPGTYQYNVSDVFGHPLAPGTNISVTAGGTNVQTNGDIAVELGDYLCPGPGRTDFSFSITPADAESDEAPVLDLVTITVTSPNGDARLTRSRTVRTSTASTDVFERLDK